MTDGAAAANKGEEPRRERDAPKRKRLIPSVEAEREWAKVARRFQHTDARTHALLRDAYLAGYLRAKHYGY